MHNHLPFNGILGNKKAMFYILKEYCETIKMNLFDIVPLTFHIKQGMKD
jgi:tubulin--tyrosine ligase